MQTLLLQFPDMETLGAGLTSVFRSSGCTAGPVTVLHREPNIYASSFPSEIVTCRLEDGRELRLLCKYTAGYNHNAHGHRGGVAYEAAVYRDVLQPSRSSTPTLYGTHGDGAAGEIWLILEYLDGCQRMNKTGEPAAMRLAARWIGQFHAVNESRLQSAPMPPLNRYDVDYYLGWIRRTRLFADDLHPRLAWLAPLCDRFEEWVRPLTALPLTVIHGEYYPRNVLFRDGTVYPVDWESAAVAVGEIDLVSLTEGWPPAVVQECEREYLQSRWPGSSPADFDWALGAARLYMQFRWLGDRQNWTTHRGSLWRFEQLRAAGERCGLISE